MSLSPDHGTSSGDGRAAPGEVATGPHKSVVAGGECIVVIEDERHTRMALQRFLQREGWQTLGFANAAAASAWLAEDFGPDGPATRPVAGAVVDLHLPDGDGIELTAALRRRLGDAVPIVIVSGDTSMDTLRRLADAGANRFVGKPMNLAALREALPTPTAAPDA